MIILYIIVRTHLEPEDAPLPEPDPMIPPGEKGQLFRCLPQHRCCGLSHGVVRSSAFFELSGSNAASEGDPAGLDTGAYALAWRHRRIALLSYLFCVWQRARQNWLETWAKGLVAPMVVIGVVLGSIYGGITGITEAAGMGALAVLIIAILRGEGVFELFGKA